MGAPRPLGPLPGPPPGRALKRRSQALLSSRGLRAGGELWVNLSAQLLQLGCVWSHKRGGGGSREPLGQSPGPLQAPSLSHLFSLSRLMSCQPQVAGLPFLGRLPNCQIRLCWPSPALGLLPLLLIEPLEVCRSPCGLSQKVCSYL